MNIYQKLQICRNELQNASLKKTGFNPFAKFKYFELGDFLPTVIELFMKYELFSNMSINNNIAYLAIINAEKPDEKEVFQCPFATSNLKGCHDVQNLGSSITYLKRYLYMNALDIVENDTVDAIDNTVKSQKATVAKNIDKKLANKAKEIPTKKGSDISDIGIILDEKGFKYSTQRKAEKDYYLVDNVDLSEENRYVLEEMGFSLSKNKKQYFKEV